MLRKATSALNPLSLRPGTALLAIAAFVVASLVATLIAWGAAVVIENRSAKAVSDRLGQEGFAWAAVGTDGLQVRLTGTAPNEASRFRAVNLAGTMVDASRIVDDMEVAPARAIEAPKFSVEMLRNDDGIQLIGLLPAGEEEQQLTDTAAALMPGTPLAEMIETATYPAAETWTAAFDYGVAALKLLPRSKISVDADRVHITAIAASDAEKRQFEAQLGRSKPEGVDVTIDISAPRPVLTPFTLRFVKDAEGARFDACSADTEAARDRILSAAIAAGVEGRPTCTIGLGVPTPSWAAAAEAGIRAVSELGAGTVTFSDADVTLLASEDTPQATFDRVVGELQNALPGVFSLDATLPKKEITAPAGPAEFTASLNGETGRVELRGRLTDEMQRNAVNSFARARFGSDKVYVATRFDPELPGGWPVRVLAALESLAELHEGTALVRADLVEVKGVTGSQQGRARISQILSGKLGQGQTFRVDVRYDEAFDPLAALPTPQECHDMIAALFAKQKITFAPGSAEIDAQSGPLMGKLADILRKCEGVRMEIGGHTDAQGSEEGNRALSQARAEAVLMALQGRRVDISYLKAVGYGEANPIADNGTEAGREANRRIEFTLTDKPKTPAPQTPAAQAGETPPPANQPNAEGGEDAGDENAGDGGDAAALAVQCRNSIVEILDRQKISFDPGSARIAAAANGVVAAIADRLKACPGVPMEIGGYTDSQGSERGNQRLSQDRANEVMAALVRRGVDPTVLKATGYGEVDPIADNGTEEGREANRRIAFALIGQPEGDDAGTDADMDMEGTSDAPAMDAPDAEQPAAAPDAPAAGDGPDFSGDDSPSVAPQVKTQQPRPRPAQDG
ncbi:MAG: OmpA family protein [Paracoccaceae bacterium]